MARVFVLIITGTDPGVEVVATGYATLDRLNAGGARLWDARVIYPAEEGEVVDLLTLGHVAGEHADVDG